jgi:HrpA-like RNA helicase
MTEFVVAAPSMDSDRALGLSDPEYCPKHRLLQVRSYSRVACHHIELEMTGEGEDLVRAVETAKGIGALRSQDLLKAEFDPWDSPANGFGPGGIGRFQRPVRAFVENQEFSPVKTRKDFKIAEKSEEILAALEDHQVIVLVGRTGSGKSTYIPWLLLTGGEPGKLSKWAKAGPICVTQPRIQATRQVPGFIANSLNGTSLGVGAQVGFSHSGSDEYDRRTRLIFKTDGKLINDIVSGAVANYSIIMIDEAHERSVNIDLILGLLKDQMYLYPHLRLIIASATIDHETFIGFYGGSEPERVPLVKSEGIQYPVQKHWWGDPKDIWWKEINKGQVPNRQQLPRSIGQLVMRLCSWLDELTGEERTAEDGHILVFLPGSREIDQTVSLINALHLPNVIALPLYRQKSIDEQQAAFNPTKDKHPHVVGKRRVVVSTNVAETSLTIEGVKHVIEPGYIKESYWNPSGQILELRTVRHSKAGCRQRWGRAGRICPGHAYLFYSESDFADFPDDSSPEIARASLEQVVLTAKAAGVRSQTSTGRLEFEWIPLKREADRARFDEELARAHTSLMAQGAIDGDGDLTRAGLEMRGMPADLHVARICMEAERHGMGIEAATLLPFLRLNFGLPSLLSWNHSWDSYQKYSIRQHQLDLVWGCADDLDLYVKLWLLWDEKAGPQREDWAEAVGLDVGNFEKHICEERRKLLESIKDWRKSEDRPPSLSRLDALRALIAHCVPTEIYVPTEEQRRGASDKVRSRFAAPDLLAWQAFWGEGGLYQEYDEDISYDESYTAQRGSRCGIYTRLNPTSKQPNDADQLEIVPTSMCFGRDDLEMIVACQRRANFNHPVRTKVVGMNNILFCRAWLPAIQGSLAERCFLYAQLSRLRETREHEKNAMRLLLPELAPRDVAVKATVEEVLGSGGLSVSISLRLPVHARVRHTSGECTVKGQVRGATLGGEIRAGQQLQLRIEDYDIDAKGTPCLLLANRKVLDKAFSDFSRRFRAGQSVSVEMLRVLDDPLGRSPMFLVRESTTGLEIPMADTDFCGDTVPRAYFGSRFAAGDSFYVRIDDIDTANKQVRVSRGRQLLQEYLSMLAGMDFRVSEVEIRRVDPLGVYVGTRDERTGFVGFVRHALWPGELPKEPGATCEARIRRFERQFTLEELKDLAQKEVPLPRELDLGIDFDLLLPLAYNRFAESAHVGYLLRGVKVDKALENGGLLVSLNPELKGIIWDMELGLDAEGKLRRARSYAPDDELVAIIIKMNNQAKTVRLSLSRVAVPPASLKDSVIDVTVLHTRGDFRDRDALELTCSFERNFIAKVKAPRSVEDHVAPGCVIRVHVRRIDNRTNLVEGELTGLV